MDHLRAKPINKLAVISEGLADEIVSLQDIANSIIRNLEVWFLWI